jgi:ferredoxin
MTDNKPVQLTIDGQTTQAAPGTTIHAAAAALGIRIPTLCWKPGFHPSGSCMVCAVQAVGRSNLIPSCTAVVEEGLRIETGTDEVRAARRTALELLLSDHAGDCEGLCRRGCPAGLDIPAMIRAIGSGRMAQAVDIVWDTIALPAILGRICPAPCEKICRRGAADAPVSICLLKRHVGDWALAQDPSLDPVCGPTTGKRVAIIGAGPAGLAAAFELRRAGHACLVFDEHAEPGGGLHHAEKEGRLVREVRAGEIARLTRMGVRWQLGERVDLPGALAGLRADYDAVILALGALGKGWEAEWGEPYTTGAGWISDRATGATGSAGVFVAGGMSHPSNLAVRALADGRRVARAVDHGLRQGPVIGEPHRYGHQAGHLNETELATLMRTANPEPRREPAGDGFTVAEADEAAGRCFQCDCRRKTDCRLRDLADELAVHPARFKGRRRSWEIDGTHPGLFYESGKCIACGLCIEVSRREGAAKNGGLAFWGRGLGIEVRPPWGRDWGHTLTGNPAAYLAACPTGALSKKG